MGTKKDWSALLDAAVAAKATDLHLLPERQPHLRTPAGRLEPLGESALSGEEIEKIARHLFGKERLERQPERGVLTLGFRHGEGCMARVSAASTRGQRSLSVRLRYDRLPTLETLNVPAVVTERLLTASHGLIVVAGPHGSGKTTTLYALLDWLNRERTLHICTIEDPIHYELSPGKSLVQQREVGIDAPDVASGIAAAIEQDLDVLLVGEVRELEALSAALHAAQTGHLVLMQLHAESGRDALVRLVEAAPESMHPLIRRALGESLLGVTSQRLIPKVGGGRVSALEVLVADDALKQAVQAGGDLSGLGDSSSVTLRESVDALHAAGQIDDAWAEQARGWGC